ncbi:MAG: helix-turn-helix transcriptional regulator [Microbacterium gubbeenense]
MQKSPERRWRADELAQAVSLSRAQLNRLFRDQIGIPPAAYLSMLRANRMAELLSTKHITVAEAAGLAGWERPEIATRTFKKQFGMGPRDYATIARAQRPGTEDLAERVSRPTHTRPSAWHPQ